MLCWPYITKYLDEKSKTSQICLFLSAEGAECIQQELYKGVQKDRCEWDVIRRLLATCSWVSLESMAPGADFWGPLREPGFSVPFLCILDVLHCYLTKPRELPHLSPTATDLRLLLWLLGVTSLYTRREKELKESLACA